MALAFTQDQFDAMMGLMQKQVDTINKLSNENAELRKVAPSGVKRPDRPIIDVSGSDNDWAIFTDAWKRYKKMVRLSTNEEVLMELRACCSSEVNKLLFEFVGPARLDSATENELLSHIKSVAVKGVHKEVHRLRFTQLRQGEKEPINQFVGRLKAQAALCEFAVNS